MPSTAALRIAASMLVRYCSMANTAESFQCAGRHRIALDSRCTYRNRTARDALEEQHVGSEAQLYRNTDSTVTSGPCRTKLCRYQRYSGRSDRSSASPLQHGLARRSYTKEADQLRGPFLIQSRLSRKVSPANSTTRIRTARHSHNV